MREANPTFKLIDNNEEVMNKMEGFYDDKGHFHTKMQTTKTININNKESEEITNETSN